jgi:hypothetical protein
MTRPCPAAHVSDVDAGPIDPKEVPLGFDDAVVPGENALLLPVPTVRKNATGEDGVKREQILEDLQALLAQHGFHVSDALSPAHSKAEKSDVGQGVVDQGQSLALGRPRPLQKVASREPLARPSSSLAGPNHLKFDKDQLKVIYEKPYKQASRQAAFFGAGIVGIMSMPFGPIGMAAGGVFGALCGGGMGYVVDRRTITSKVAESLVAKKRLTSLIRWAISRSHDEEEIVMLIEHVTLEFKPIADIAAVSKQARKLLRVLESWIAQKGVTRQLWAYMDTLLVQWRHLNRADFLRSMHVFQTLTTMYKFSPRVLDQHELQFLQRMERLLQHESVKAVMSHAQLYPTSGETQVMECMVYYDASRKRSDSASSRPRSPSVGSGSPRDAHVDLEDASDDSDDEIAMYAGQGSMLAPCQAEPSPSNLSIHSEESLEKQTIQVKVLKKPFFRGWADFMDFDLTFKHKMPITLSEFGLLTEKAEESNDGWDVCVDRADIKVSKQQTGEGVITLRAWATVPGVELCAAFYLFHNFEERVKWDKVYETMKLIGQPEKGSDLLYSVIKAPIVTPRDFLQYRRARVMEDGSVLIVLRSAQHPDCPENKSNIRAETFISGYVLRQDWDGDKPILNVFLMSCLDIKGLIPKWIVNSQAPKKPADWVDTLRRAALDYQKSNPNFRTDLQPYMKKFAEENEFDFEYQEVVSVAAKVGGVSRAKQPPSSVEKTKEQELKSALSVSL